MGKYTVIALLVTACLCFGCSQPAHPPKAKPTEKATRLEPVPGPKHIALKMGTVYQTSVAVPLATQAEGNASETLPSNGYFRATSDHPDGWYEVTVSDGSSDYTRWLDAKKLDGQSLRECPGHQVVPSQLSEQYNLKAEGNSAGQVYITDTGKKFHRADCRSLKESRIPCSRVDAQGNGYTPCSLCNP